MYITVSIQRRMYMKKLNTICIKRRPVRKKLVKTCTECMFGSRFPRYVLHKTQNMWILTSNILHGVKEWWNLPRQWSPESACTHANKLEMVSGLVRYTTQNLQLICTCMRYETQKNQICIRTRKRKLSAPVQHKVHISMNNNIHLILQYMQSMYAINNCLHTVQNFFNVAHLLKSAQNAVHGK